MDEIWTSDRLSENIIKTNHRLGESNNSIEDQLAESTMFKLMPLNENS